VSQPHIDDLLAELAGLGHDIFELRVGEKLRANRALSKAVETCQHPAGFGSELGGFLIDVVDARGAL